MMQTLEIGEIHHSTHLQARKGQVNNSLVKQYATAMAAGEQFPPIDVTHRKESGHHIILDGHHRYFAAKKAGLQEIPVTVHQLTAHQEIEFAALANLKHGRGLSKAEKQVALLMLLESGWHEKSLREIATPLNIDKNTVLKWWWMAYDRDPQHVPEPHTPRPATNPDPAVGSTDVTVEISTTPDTPLTKLLKIRRIMLLPEMDPDLAKYLPTLIDGIRAGNDWKSISNQRGYRALNVRLTPWESATIREIVEIESAGSTARPILSESGEIHHPPILSIVQTN